MDRPDHAGRRESTATPVELRLDASRHLTPWLHERQLSFAFSTYQAGKLFMIGTDDRGDLSVSERTFSRCMGLYPSGESLWMASQFQVWRLENSIPRGARHDGFDALYVPRVGYTTGDLDVPDIAVGRDGKPVFVSTAFSCVATLSERFSFKPLWRPDFVSALVPEDRCHLNGLAMRDKKPRYVTAVSRSDVAEGWRDARRAGGVVIDMDSNEVIAHGLSMPHSPRWHKDRLWLHNSGTGEFGYVIPGEGEFVPVVFIPGYARGLAIHNGFALVGMSRPRHGSSFSGLALDDELRSRNAEAQVGVQLIDLARGVVVASLRISGYVEELFDVAWLPSVARPTLLGFKSDAILHTITIDQ